MEFSKQEYWSGWPIPSPADLPDPGIEPVCPALQVDSLPTELSGKLIYTYVCGCVYIHTHMYIVAVVQLPSCVLLFVTPWTAACQAPLSVGFSKQECWMGCHFLLHIYVFF